MVGDLRALFRRKRDNALGCQGIELGPKGADAVHSLLRGGAITAGSLPTGIRSHATLILMEQLILTVTGMTCGGCENAVQRAVSRLEGVHRVSASHADNRVLVEYDAAKVDRARVSQAIANAGYHVAPA